MKNILIIGCGLIGSSVLRAAYVQSAAKNIYIYEKSKKNISIIKKLRVTYKIINNLKNISINFEYLKSKKFYTEKNIKKLTYLSNKNYVKDLLLFSISLDKKINGLNIEKLINYLDNCKVPKFPISGAYLKEYGYETGQALGKKLKSLEEKWIENNFVIDKAMLKKSLGKIKEN